MNESLELNFGKVEPSRIIGSADPVMNWSAIVRAYSCRKLTSSDKLPALSGLVSAFQRRQGWTYVAGLEGVSCSASGLGRAGQDNSADNCVR